MKFLNYKKILSSLTIIASLICVGLISIQALSNSDVWLWLKTGELITKTREFPTQDFLSHTAQGREWIVHAWGFGVLIFTIYQHLGELGLAAFRLSVALLVFLILRKTAKILNAPPDILFAVIICFSFSVIANAWMTRPHLLGALYISILMLILTLYRLGKTTPIYAVPLLTIVWANTHASLPIAFILMLLLLGSELLEKLLRSETTINYQLSTIETKPFNFKLLTAIIPASFLTSLLNPYHFKIYQYFFKINTLVRENILEWLPLAFFFDWSQIKAFLIFIALVAITLILVFITAPKKISYFEIGLTLISSYLALSALRHIVIAVIILTPIFTKNAGLLLKKARGLLPLLSLTTIVILTLNPFKRVVRGEWGISPDLLSIEAINFVKEARPRGNMYNHFNFGSTLLWHLYPQYQTFIDGRVDMFVPDIYQEWLTVGMNEEGWERILEKYGVGWIIFKTRGVWPDLKESLKRESGWCLVFWDDTASVILKKESNEALCQKYGYRLINPWDSAPPRKEEITEELKGECQRALESSSWNVGARNKLGVVYAVEGKIEEAKEQLRIAIETGPPYPITYLNLADLYENQEPQKAIAILEQAAKKNPAAPGPFKKLALIYGRKLDEKGKARKYLRRYKKLTTDVQEKAWAEQEMLWLNQPDT